MLKTKPHVTQIPRKFLTFNTVSDFVTYILTAKTTCHLIAKKNSSGTDCKKSEITRYFSVLSLKENPSPQIGTHKHEGVQKEKGSGDNVHQEQILLPQGQE